MPNASEVIDVDALPDPPSDDSEIEFTGFRRDPSKSKLHIEELDTEGVTYIGFKDIPQPVAIKRPLSIPKDVPPAKRHKPSPPATTNPQLKRPHHAIQSSSRKDIDVISISDSESDCKLESDSDWSSEEDEPPFKRMALSRPDRDTDDAEVIALAQGMLESLAFEASAAEKVTRLRSLDGLRFQQSQSRVFDWLRTRPASREPNSWTTVRRSLCSSLPRTLQPRWQRDFSRWIGLHTSGSIWRAPGDINTIVQARCLIIMASAVADGTAGDNAGPYNRDGTLVVWPKRTDYWAGHEAQTLDDHSQDVTTEPGHYATHHFTVNDVAIDPSCSSRFASAGRDSRVLLWDCANVPEGRPPELVEEIKCDDNPEVVKYRPGESTVAIQCDNGSVYLHADGSSTQLEIVRASRGHYTAEMAWGFDATSGFLFASSASPDDARGHHKMFDVPHHKVVVEFDASKEACSTLVLDPFGERLFIATEGPEAKYNLRQFDVRARLRRPVQQTDLEPFLDVADKASIDINSLSLSADALYLAVGRTDNWVDVYDARMLARGPLHSLAHEDSDKPDRRKMYGVVKTEWVEGAPYGAGLVSGGADGCVRLWDVRLSSDDARNGTVLARCDNDVSTFALGDVYKGEAPLIVGVCSGEVTVLEHISEPIED